MERTHYIYEAYDADGICLYVGCTAKPSQRYRQHMSGDNDARGWFGQFVTQWRVSGPYSPEVARRIEKSRIAEYQPIFNGHSKANFNGRRQLIEDYLDFHGLEFVQSPSNWRRSIAVPIRRQKVPA